MIIASGPSFQPQVHSFLRDSNIVQNIRYTQNFFIHMDVWQCMKKLLGLQDR